MSRIERICLKSMVRSGREADTRCVLTVASLLLWVGSEIMLGDTLMIWPVLFAINSSAAFTPAATEFSCVS